ncbi:ATP-dependent translocase ABCB1-like [Anneissia japonica]|uniref:ATP-dependent translocase ABCB1-like n=1 Tax=Anneissia japonica TaxID=1529436 RepID=UPI001425AD27|nr:ATP-dependent translocase ABCB1-like [Anneissia japonica]
MDVNEDDEKMQSELNKQNGAVHQNGKHNEDKKYTNGHTKDDHQFDDADVEIKDGEEKEKEKEVEMISLLNLFRYAKCQDVMLMIIGSIFSLAVGAGWPALMLVFGELTDELVAYESVNSTITPSEFEDEMAKFALYFGIIALVIMFSGFMQIALWGLACQRQINKIRKEYFKSVLRQNIGWFDTHASGELNARLSDDVERIREGIGDKCGLALQYFGQFISGFAVGFYKSWELSLVMMSLTPLLAICGTIITKIVTQFAKKEQDSYAKAGSVAEEVLSAIRTVVAFGGENKEKIRYAKELETAKDVGIRKGQLTGISMGVTMFIMFCSYALAFWYGPRMIVDGKISGGDVIVVFFSVLVGSFGLGTMAPHLSNIATARGAAFTIYNIIDTVPPIDSYSTDGKKPKEVKGNIEFRDVQFSYPTRPDVEVLKRLNLNIKSGQMVALVGASGCGKSTTVALLQRFYSISGGQIIIDGNDLTDLNINWMRKDCIGVVSQEPILFATTIYENIAYGRDGVTNDEIVAAAKSANAHDFISKLPEGYNTMVGERGTQLSGGQKQRVAIARALVRNPKILLLDEATSALDSESERVVQEALDAAQVGRTTLVIAHRLSTIKNADVIYAIDEGSVAESGSHDELMAKNGVYAQLVTLQELRKQEEQEAMNDGENSSAAVPNSPIKRQISTRLSRQMSTRSTHSEKSMGKAGKEEQKIEELELEDQPAPEVKYMDILRLNSPEWLIIANGCFWSSVQGVVWPVWAFFFAEFIKVFGLPQDELEKEANLWASMFLVLGVAIGVASLMSAWMYSISGERLTMRLRNKAFASVLRQDIGWFDDPKHSTGALIHRLATDASNVKNATGIRVGTTVQALVTLLVALIMAFIYGWKLSLVVLSSVPLLMLGGMLEMQSFAGHQKQNDSLLEEASKTATESIENMRTVASLTLEKHMHETYSKYMMKPHKKAMKAAFVSGIAYGFSQGMVMVMYAAAFRYGGYLIAQGEMTGTDVFKVFHVIAFAGISIGQAFAFVPDFSKAQVSTARMIQLFNLVPKIDSCSTTGKKPDIVGEIKYSDLVFSYPTRPNITVLRKLDLTVASGKTLALVGASGCGKSTLISMLERFYDPAEGSVMVDSNNIKTLNLPFLRSQMSIVSQEPVLFNCTIRENIAYSVENIPDLDAIINVAKQANIHDFISSLPEGYETSVGEKGTQLSGGQKQRVAIARALLRNPKILLLDEATSALDTESEKVVQEAIDRAKEGRTCIVIAHRLSTIQNSDAIAVIDDGKVIEMGTHDELMAKRESYFTLAGGLQK